MKYLQLPHGLDLQKIFEGRAMQQTDGVPVHKLKAFSAVILCHFLLPKRIACA